MNISKIKFAVMVLVGLPFAGFGQTATFKIDTLTPRNSSGNDGADAYLKEMQWKINGEILTYKTGKIEVAVNKTRLDTMFYKQSRNSDWDTILFHAKDARTYQIMYNACCGGFDLADDTGHLIVGQVQFKISGKPSKKMYLGTLGEAGIIVSGISEVLKPACRSAMSPNIYTVTLAEIKTCRDTIDCTDGTCLFEKGKKESNYNFSYKTIATKFNFLYMPLSDDPIQIVYDPKSNKYGIESN